jgi:rubrerythrin
LIAALGVFILINFYRRRRMMKRYGIETKGMKNLFGWLPSSMSGKENSPLKYYCMSCGTEHKEIACPKCGSKMKRVG